MHTLTLLASPDSQKIACTKTSDRHAGASGALNLELSKLCQTDGCLTRTIAIFRIVGVVDNLIIPSNDFVNKGAGNGQAMSHTWKQSVSSI